MLQYIKLFIKLAEFVYDKYSLQLNKNSTDTNYICRNIITNSI